MKQNVSHKKFIRICLMCLLSIAIPQRLAAQGDAEAADYKGKGMALSEVTLANRADDIPDITNTQATRILLYNVGKDMFLNAGGYWGTRTATFTVGLPLIFSKSKKSNAYYIRGPFANPRGDATGSVLAFVNDKSLTRRGLYYDRNVNYTSLNNPDFYFEKVNSVTDDNVYRIYISQNYSKYYLCANCPMIVNVFEKGNNNLVRALTESERQNLRIAEEYTYWKIVSDKNMEALFTEDYKGKMNTLADASFLMRAQGFNISNIYNEYKTVYGRGWRTEGKVEYVTGYEQAFAHIHNGDTGGFLAQLAPNFGMFQCAGLRKAEKGNKLYQTVTLSKTGWYMLECQGFFNDENKQAPYANLYAKFLDDNGKDPVKGSAAWATTPLLGKSYGEAPERLGKVDFNEETFKAVVYKGNAFLADDISDGKVSNKVEAGVLFYSRLYPNSVMIYANIPEGKSKVLEVGIEMTKDMVSPNTNNADAAENDYIYVDDFRLKYLGESFALSEDWNNFKKPGNNTSEEDYTASYANKALIFKRTFTTGKWNSICLPVDLKKWQLQKAFSVNVKLAKLVECTHTSEHAGRIEFSLVPLNEKADNDIVMKSGECYIINPGEGSVITEGTADVGDVNLSNIAPPYYIIPQVSLNKNNMIESVLNLNPENLKGFHAFDYEGGKYVNDKSYGLKGAEFQNCRLDIYATFEGSTDAPANSYIFYGGDIYHLTSPFPVPGYSWWIVDQDQGTTPAKRHSLAFGIGGIIDNTTVIEGITAGTAVCGTAAVYNLWGQAVRRGTTDLSGLPSGIYVVNGKKVSVR